MKPEILFLLNVVFRLILTHNIKRSLFIVYIICSLTLSACIVSIFTGKYSVVYFRARKWYVVGEALSLWATVCHSLSYLTNGLFQDQLLYTLIGSLSLLLLIILKPSEPDYEVLLNKVDRNTSLQNFLEKTETLMIISHHRSSKNLKLLYGYIELHQSSCFDDSCNLDFSKLSTT